MKLIAYLLLALSAVAGVWGVEVQKSFLMSFDKNTPDSVYQDMKKTVTDAKGYITHEYSIIKGFAATAGEKVFEELQFSAQNIGATVEEDEQVNINPEHRV